MTNKAMRGSRGFAGWMLALGMLATTTARAEAEDGPEALVQAVATDVLETVKADPEMQNGNLPRIMELVDRRVMPHVDMARLTGLAMARHWRQATPAQQALLQAEFKVLLVRSYAGALSLVNARQTVELRPTRTPPGSSEVIVVTRIRGRGDPVAIDYRLYRSVAGLAHLRRQLSWHLAGRELPQQFRRRDRRQRHRRPDRETARPQHEQELDLGERPWETRLACSVWPAPVPPACSCSSVAVPRPRRHPISISGDHASCRWRCRQRSTSTDCPAARWAVQASVRPVEAGMAPWPAPSSAHRPGSSSGSVSPPSCRRRPGSVPPPGRPSAPRAANLSWPCRRRRRRSPPS